MKVDIARLNEYTEIGLITRQSHSSLPLDIYCYSKEAMHSQRWDSITTLARGIVVDRASSEIVTKPFYKFFNYGEPACPKPPDLPYAAYEKLDGSLLNASWYEGKLVLTTKASFANDYIEYAYQFMKLFESMPKGFTYMTEVVLPTQLDSMKRAVNHEPGLYLLGATRMSDLADIALDQIASDWKGFVPITYKNSISELLERSVEDTGTEGWVIRYSDGFRLKIKTAWYLRVFKAINRLGDQLKAYLTEGRKREEILSELPEEFEKEVDEFLNSYSNEFDSIASRVEGLYSALEGEGSRKAFALEAIKATEECQELRPLLFKKLDHKSIDQDITKLALSKINL